MFRPINKQVTPKFTSANKQQKCTNTQLLHTNNQKTIQLQYLRVGNKVKNVAKTVAVPPAALAPQVSKKTPPAEDQKHASRPNNKEAMAKEKPPVVEKPEQSKKIIAGVTPRTRIVKTKIFAFGSTLCSPSIRPNFPRYISNSNQSDFKVTNTGYKPTMSSIFSYDLSNLERNEYGTSQEKHTAPMKLVSPTEKQLLADGLRSTYLERRYESSPDAKYNYPEATSMRYGWFHRHADLFQKRVPRRD